MRNGQFSLAELQLSSPLPSPNRQLSGNNNNRHTNLPQQHATHNNTATESAISLEPLYFDSPQHHSDLYPLASMPTPESIRKFTFTVDGHPSLFVETNNIPPRKRSASSWEDERNLKRTELPSAESPTFHPEATNTTIDADSPNSALPSPVSDVDDTWEEQQLQLQELQQAKQEQEHEEKVNVIMEQEEEFKKQVEQQKIVDEDQKMELKPSCSQASLLDTFDQLPDNIQTYFMFQLLKRSPRPALRIANSTIMQVLKTDLITQLPECLSIHILSFLDVKSLCRATGVNRAWQSLVSNDELWRLKMMECDFHPSAEESSTTYKRIVKRHTLMRRNWQHNRFHKMQLQGHENNVVTCLQFDDDKIITGSDDQSINVYDIRTGQRRRVLKGHDGGVWALQYVGNTLVTGSTDRTIRVWDIDAGVCRFVLRGHSSTVRCLKIVMPMPMENGLLEPSEPLIVSGSRDTTIRVWRLPDISQPPSDDDEDGAKFLKYTLMEHEHSVRDLATYGNILVSGSYDNNVIVWDLHTGRRLHTLDGHQMKVYSVVIDAKRRQCISGSLDASVRIWGLDDGQCKNILQGHAILVGLLGLVDDYLVSAAADATLRVWDAKTGQRLHVMAGSIGHQGPITSFQHDKYKIISGSEGGVKMWNIQTGELMYDLIDNVTGVWRVAFDERRCVAAVKIDRQTQLVVLDYGIHGLEDTL